LISAGGAGSLISKLAIPVGTGQPNGTSQYEVNTTLNVNPSLSTGGVFVHYLRASPDALSGPSPQGTFYSVELAGFSFNGNTCSGAQLFVYKRVSGSLTLLAGVQVPCKSGMTVRSVITQASRIIVFVNGVMNVFLTDPDITTGAPGVGIFAPADNSIARVDIGRMMESLHRQ
jgi:hypothetical protein